MFCGVEEELGETLGGVRWSGREARAEGGLDGAEEGEEWGRESVGWW